ncbi:MAG: prolyl oligopeptidase family serine peptidase [Sedimentisphaerales bacterium]|nr:prolyl oligopeptidase family serine peptidase [Sedimentisphaerales bacterium]
MKSTLDKAMISLVAVVFILSTGRCNPIWNRAFIGGTEGSIQTVWSIVNDEKEDDAVLDTNMAISPQQRRGFRRSDNRVYKAGITPHWFADNMHFWYRNDLRAGLREFILIDAVKGVRKPAFDHERLANALKSAGMTDVHWNRLPIQDLAFRLADNTLYFRIGENSWQCDLEIYKLQKLDVPFPSEVPSAISIDIAPRASTRTGAETSLTFVNRTSGEVELFWLDAAGGKHSYGKLEPGEERQQHTYAGHVWRIVDSKGAILSMSQAEDYPTRVEITESKGTDALRRMEGRQRNRPRSESSGGRWKAFVRDGNVFIRSNDNTIEIQLSHDGDSHQSYGMLEWAPDLKTLVAFRIEPGDQKEVHLIESSPKGGGRAVLHSRSYDLPGDTFTAYELNLFNVGQKTQLKPDMDRIDFGRPRLRWNTDGHRFTYEKIDRGHQRFRVIEVDSHTGNSRNIIDERSDTFIWTAHTENIQLNRVNWIPDSNEIVYASERDGWRHLYLIDAETAQIKNQITQGQFVVRAIDRIDQEQRQVWFRASGMNPEQDPYFIHYYRINFDGSGLVALTEGDGDHTIQYSPDRAYIIDTYSRVDTPPVHELRRVSNGRLVCELEKADISQLEDEGRQPPEVFVTKGRDGKTNIWGIICRPTNLDPEKKYPIVEDIYAGPQSAYVPKRFSSSRRYALLTDLGFIVVKIDGMGTAHRSKAFHDICWHNLKDAGFEDRILWIKSAAKKYPYMDAEKVGIYGTSAGGQNAAGALLFHPEFYKVAVASCGCHDNRMDKASWNEQWMGYPVGPQYTESSNIENAWRLQGHLMLIVGEMDTNVPPESTMRFVDALIKADKDFELLIIPGSGHGSGGAYGERRCREFLAHHLLKASQPDTNSQLPPEDLSVRNPSFLSESLNKIGKNSM